MKNIHPHQATGSTMQSKISSHPFRNAHSTTLPFLVRLSMSVSVRRTTGSATAAHLSPSSGSARRERHITSGNESVTQMHGRFSPPVEHCEPYRVERAAEGEEESGSDAALYHGRSKTAEGE